MSAKETLLGDLHQKLAEAYLRELEGQEVTPALLTSIAKFLKDNGIQAEVGEEGMHELKKAAQSATVYPFAVDG